MADDNNAMPATPLAGRRPHPDMTPHRAISASELERMTAWEYLSQAGSIPDTLRHYKEGNSVGIAKFKDRYPTLCSAPARRELKYSSDRRPNTMKMNFNLVGLLIYVAGVPAAESCCKPPNTPEGEGGNDTCQAMYDGCIVALKGPMQEETLFANVLFQLFKSFNSKDILCSEVQKLMSIEILLDHACANCYYNGDHTRCRFYVDTQIDAYKEALARDRRDDNDDDDEDDSQDKRRKKRKNSDDDEYVVRAVRQQLDTPRRTGLRSQGRAPAV
ncbi:hypothetical protein BJ166DRAFT_612597 [Pestalotiopsis sp. NC0098]|nr:hypothetical protein BJ166DRAFT_612597 [Pestalotiopsis sp. NC0098]